MVRMSEKNYTTREAAQILRRSYDHTRKLLASLPPAQTIGKNKLWTLNQIESVRK